MQSRRGLAVLLAAMIWASGLLVAMPASPAHAGTAGLTVRVVADDTGLPIPDACVFLQPSVDGTPYGPAEACDPSGAVTFPSLMPGESYIVGVVGASGDGYLGEFVPNARVPEDAVPVIVPSDLTVGLARGVKASGTLTHADGSPITDGIVVSFDPLGVTGSPTTANFDANGRWTATLRPGNYRVSYDSFSGSGWARGASSAATAAVITAGPGDLLLDDHLPTPTSVTGTITDRTTKAPVSGACATITRPGDPRVYIGCSDSSGRYTIGGVPGGAGTLRATDPGHTYAPSSPVPVTVVEGRDQAGPNVSLQVGAVISGTVVDRDTGAPLAGICPSAFNGRGGAEILRDEQGAVCSDATGAWSISGLPAQNVTVNLTGDSTHAERWAGDVDVQRTATRYQLRLGRTTATGTVGLYHGGTLTGRVTDQQGNPIAFAAVSMGPWPGGVGYSQFNTWTEADGTYVLHNLPTDPRPVLISTDGKPFAWQWSAGASDPDQALPIAVPAEGTRTLDVVLRPEAGLTISLTDGHPEKISIVQAYTMSGAAVGFTRNVRGDHPVTLHGLPAGPVRIQVVTPDGRVLWYDNQTAFAAAQRVRVSTTRPTTLTMAIQPPPGS